MGSTFTEGSIVQHLAKLRNKMESVNNVPVPPPTRRGAVTSKPSAIYAPKSRLLLPPVPRANAGKNRPRPPPPVFDGEISPTSHQPSTRGRKASNIAIKRSSSDDDGSDDEFVDRSEDEQAPRKRKRAAPKRKQANTQAQTDQVLPSGSPWIPVDHDCVKMLRTLQYADKLYAQKVDANPSAFPEENDPAYQIRETIEPHDDGVSGGPSANTRGIRRNYTILQQPGGASDSEEEEAEEDEGEDAQPAASTPNKRAEQVSNFRTPREGGEAGLNIRLVCTASQFV